MNLSLDFPVLGLLLKGPSVPVGSLFGNSSPVQKAGCLMSGGFHSAPRGGRGLGGRQHRDQKKGLEPEWVLPLTSSVSLGSYSTSLSLIFLHLCSVDNYTCLKTLL